MTKQGFIISNIYYNNLSIPHKNNAIDSIVVTSVIITYGLTTTSVNIAISASDISGISASIGRILFIYEFSTSIDHTKPPIVQIISNVITKSIGLYQAKSTVPQLINSVIGKSAKTNLIFNHRLMSYP